MVIQFITILLEACIKGGANRSLSEIAISPPVHHAPHAQDFHIDESKNFNLDKSYGTLMRQN